MKNQSAVHIGVCADRHILPGLHVTVSTALRHLAPECKLHIHLVHRGLTDADVGLIRETLDKAGRPYELRTIPVDIGALDGLSGIRGNVMTWARFMLPQWLPNLDRVLYLDSDLAVLTDISGAFNIDLNEAAAALVDTGTSQMRTAIERSLFEKLGFDLDAPYYNAGVLLMDLDRWRAGLAEDGLAFARAQGGRLGAADQTAINAIFYRAPLARLPERFNRVLYAADAFPDNFGTPENPTPGIYHFLGAPKPWDFLGEWVYKHHVLFQNALSKTALSEWRSYSSPSAASVRIAARNVKSYVRAFRNRKV